MRTFVLILFLLIPFNATRESLKRTERLIFEVRQKQIEYEIAKKEREIELIISEIEIIKCELENKLYNRNIKN